MATVSLQKNVAFLKEQMTTGKKLNKNILKIKNSNLKIFISKEMRKISVEDCILEQELP